MRRYLILLSLIVSVLNITITVHAKAQFGPVISNYGPVYEVKDMDVPLPENHKFKVIFDVYETASDINTHSRRLESAARFINMHALKGVSLENIDIAIVMHGKATKDILTNKAYQVNYQTDNPNKGLIEVLAEHGVKFYVCGQSAEFNKYQRKDILPEIKIALSAMTQLAIYQNKGYALLP